MGDKQSKQSSQAEEDAHSNNYLQNSSYLGDGSQEGTRRESENNSMTPDPD
jgi:hypothetical protein